MKQAIIYGITAAAVLVCIVGGATALHAAKPAPEAVADQQINVENFTEQKEALDALNPNEMAGGMIYDAGDGQGNVSMFADRDNNIYRYAADGRLIGLSKFVDEPDDNLPELNADQIREYADLYLAGLVDTSECYTLTDFEMRDDGSCYIVWDALCGDVITTDITSVTLEKNGTLRDFSLHHTGEFEGVTVTEAQVNKAIALAVARAVGDGEGVQLTKVQSPEEVRLTLNEASTISIAVGVSVEIQPDDPYMIEQGMTISSADIYNIPLDECI